jgi:hypothetical protein
MADTDTIKTVVESKALEDLASPAKPAPTTDKPLVAADVEAVIVLLREIEQNNGYGGIAASVGVKVAQVKEIHDKVLARIAEISPKAEELIEEPVEVIKEPK